MVFPLYDDNPFRRAVMPYTTWALMAINIVVFLGMIGRGEADQQAFVASYGAVPASLTHIADGSWWPVSTVITSLFLHGGWEHIIGNMIYLWVFGDDIEDALGPLRFLAFYFAAGIAATLGYVALNPDSTVPLIGASGAISGLLAAYLMLRPCAKVSVFVLRVVVRLPAYVVIGGWVVLQLFNSAAQSDDGVAYAAHLGGLFAGALLFLAMRPRGVALFQCIAKPEAEAS